jgi:hypothetical protein
MNRETLVALCQYLAEQAYMNNLLTERLIDAKILQRGELQKMLEAMPERRLEFCQDYLAYLKTLGLNPDAES